MTGFALVHSPFLGPNCWRKVSDALDARGQVAIAVDYGAVTGPCWHGHTARRIARVLEPYPDAALVMHSAAGALAPAIVDEAEPGGLGVLIFVDAILPHPGKTWLETAPAGLGRRLGEVSRENRLPAWNRWFAGDPIENLIPDQAERAPFVEEIPAVPAAYIHARAPDSDRWRSLPIGYLRLSAAYDEEAGEARRRDWIVESVESDHLAMITRPDTLASALMTLARRLA